MSFQAGMPHSTKPAHIQIVTTYAVIIDGNKTLHSCIINLYIYLWDVTMHYTIHVLPLYGLFLSSFFHLFIHLFITHMTTASLKTKPQTRPHYTPLSNSWLCFTVTPSVVLTFLTRTPLSGPLNSTQTFRIKDRGTKCIEGFEWFLSWHGFYSFTGLQITKQ